MIHGLVSNDVAVIEVVISICNGDGAECKKDTKRKASGRDTKQSSCYVFFILSIG